MKNNMIKLTCMKYYMNIFCINIKVIWSLYIIKSILILLYICKCYEWLTALILAAGLSPVADEFFSFSGIVISEGRGQADGCTEH